MFVEQNITLPIYMLLPSYMLLPIYTSLPIYMLLPTLACAACKVKEWAGEAYDACAETVGACGAALINSRRGQSLTITHTVTLTVTACRSRALSDPERLDLPDALCRLHLLQIGAFILLISVTFFFHDDIDVVFGGNQPLLLGTIIKSGVIPLFCDNRWALFSIY